MNRKAVNVINWVLSLLLCSLGICLCTKANFGLSMISAPPYIIHCFMRDTFSWFTQGTSEYVWETVLLVIMCLIVRRFHPKFLLSFVTAVIMGFLIDFWFIPLGGNAVYESMAVRIITFIIGAVIISLAIAFVFRTTLPPQVYELIVCEISDRFHIDQNKIKWSNDMIMLALTVVLARVLNHSWTGIGVGTVIVTVVNAPMINIFGRIIDKVEKRAGK